MYSITSKRQGINTIQAQEMKFLEGSKDVLDYIESGMKKCSKDLQSERKYKRIPTEMEHVTC